MLKRAISYVWNLEKTPVTRSAEKEYEKWTKTQLIEKIKELESVKEPVKEGESATEVALDVNSTKKKKKKKAFNFSNHQTRFIALKFAYLGWNYCGLSYQLQPTPLPTVEQKILEALAMARLIAEPDPDCCNFSRCGRTDKGVSAMNQVISLDVRSNLSKEDQANKENDGKEIPYIHVLNSLLPADIRITSVALRPPADFDARFSCDYRHYRYLFRKDGLDIELMQEAANRYVGLHDFRNFCKIDGSKQITNYKRRVFSAQILPYKDDYYMLDLKGTAFLWHQVRYMVAILLAVGQKLEASTVIDELFDVEKNPSKPLFEMANDIPLILYDCVFPDMEWTESTNDAKLLKEHGTVKELAVDYQVRAHIASIMEGVCIKKTVEHAKGCGTINIGDGKGRTFKKYVPVMQRELGERFEVVNEMYKQRKKRRKAAGADSTSEQSV